MATTIVPPATDLSSADIRSMLADKTETPATEAKPDAPAAPASTEVKTEAAPGTAETQPNSQPQQTSTQEPAEEPLPEGVQKRIAKEVEKQTRIQREIDQAVSSTKAKQAELEALKRTGVQGTDPAPTPQAPVASEKPKKPVLGETGHETESWDQFQARDDAYQDLVQKWIKAEAIKEFQQQTTAQQAQAKAQERWDAAVKEHGAEFPALMEKAVSLAPEGLQLAISGLEHWSQVAVHLAKDPQQLQDLAATFRSNPYQAVATLGRIEAALVAEKTKTAATGAEKPLPAPLAKVGGTASASGQSFQDSIESGSMSQLRATLGKLKK